MTSNPSVMAGEGMNHRDQMLVNKLDVYKKVTQDYLKFHDDMSRKIEKAKRQMYLGNIQDIISLADEFQIDSETLLALPIKTRSKCMTLRQRVEMYSDIASQMISILKLPKEDIQRKIEFENPTRREELLAKMVNSSILIREYEEQFECIEQLMNDEKWEFEPGPEELLKKYDSCYVISVHFSDALFEEPLETNGDIIKLYQYEEDAANPVYSGAIEDGWYIKGDWDYKKSAYDENGNLLVPLERTVDIPVSYSVAYIGDKDALYVNGTLYYRVK